MIIQVTGLYDAIPIGSMYGIYTNTGGILMVNVTIDGIHGSYGICLKKFMFCVLGIFGTPVIPIPIPIGVQHTRKQAFQEDRQQYPQESKWISTEHLWNI